MLNKFQVNSKFFKDFSEVFVIKKVVDMLVNALIDSNN